jgi:hypothetical protein
MFSSIQLNTRIYGRAYVKEYFVYSSGKKTPWPQSASKLYRPSDSHLSAKLVPTFANRLCHVVSVTDPYGRILGFLDRYIRQVFELKRGYNRQYTIRIWILKTYLPVRRESFYSILTWYTHENY